MIVTFLNQKGGRRQCGLRLEVREAMAQRIDYLASEGLARRASAWCSRLT